MREEQAILNLEIKKKSGLSLNPDIHHSKVLSSELSGIVDIEIKHWSRRFCKFTD